VSIYAEKVKGKPTGKWVVELVQGNRKTGTRYKKRWPSYAEAQQDEAAVLATWERGEATPAPGAAPGAPQVHTFATVIPKAKGQLWEGTSTASHAWSRLEGSAAILGMNTRLDDVDTQAVDRLIQGLKASGKSDATINRYLSALRTFLIWAKSRKYRTIPVKDEIEFAWRHESEGRIRWITAEEEAELERFLTGRGKPQATAVWHLIKIAIETGCRRDELQTAELGQINGTRLHLWKTKTDTPRTVPMTEETTQMLRDLLRTGSMPTQRSLRSWWDRARVAMGLADDAEFVFHITRHTCATRLVDAGVNVFVIKEWMGHKVIATTLRYAHVKPQNLEEALIRRGTVQAAANENRQNTVVSAVPPGYPTAGELGANQQGAAWAA
jgi:integrase